MDVTCERCGTEYEFDETLVSDRGTTVKCTQCGHLFKVFRPGGALEGAPEAMWRVRRRDGAIETVLSLRDLQRRIVQGALSPDDEISASGQPWKRLGAIAELESFFAPSGGARVPTSSPPGRPDATVPFEVQRPATEAMRPPAGPAGQGRREKRTLIGVGVGVGAMTPPAPQDGAATFVDPPRAPSVPPPKTPSVKAPPPSAPRASERPASVRPSSIPPRERRPAREHETPSTLRVHEADTVPERRRGGTGIVLGLAVVVLAMLGVGVWQRDRIAAAFGAPAEEDEVAPFLARGSEALERDDVESYQTAVFELTRATAADERDARALASLARAHGVWAQALAFEALDHDARAAADPASTGEARRARSEMTRHVDAARRFAEEALRADSSLADASLALADALRLSGDLGGAEQHLGRARQGAGAEAGELHRVAALLAAAKAGGDLARAREEALLAVESDPELVRNRVLLARALIAAGDVGAARRQLVEVGADHEMVRPLLASLDAAGSATGATLVPVGVAPPAAPSQAAPAEPPAAPAVRTERRATSSRRSRDASGASPTPQATPQATPSESPTPEPPPSSAEPAPSTQSEPPSEAPAPAAPSVTEAAPEPAAP